MRRGRSRKGELSKAQPNSTITSTCFPFLSLPLEIRMMIYRLLLCRDEPLTTFRGKFGLSPSILRICHQVLSEARIILYRENTFSMRITCDKYGTKHAYFLKCKRFAYHAPCVFGERLKEMRRFRISVELERECHFWNVKATVRDVCIVLGLCSLDYLHITLDEREGFENRSLPRVLENFTLLRNVRSVVLEGVPPVYSQYLTSKMTGCSPLDHLPKMYDALEYYAGPFECCEEGLEEARDAMEEDNVVRFRRAREELIEVVTERVADARHHLFDHDWSYPRTTPNPSLVDDEDAVSAQDAVPVEESQTSIDELAATSPSLATESSYDELSVEY